jgi:hypothetical protein
MPVPYELIVNTNADPEKYCESCLTEFAVFNLTWNKKRFSCVLNNKRSIVLMAPHSQPFRFYYRDIIRIDYRRWMKVVLVLADREIELKGFRARSAFKALRYYFLRQMVNV